MSECSNPLDPLDIEALASGAEPLVQRMPRGMPPPARRAARRSSAARSLEGLIDAVAHAGAAPADLADRVLRVRPFSRRGALEPRRSGARPSCFSRPSAAPEPF